MKNRKRDRVRKREISVGKEAIWEGFEELRREGGSEGSEDARKRGGFSMTTVLWQVGRRVTGRRDGMPGVPCVFVRDVLRQLFFILKSQSL